MPGQNGDSGPESTVRRYRTALVGGSFFLAAGVVLAAGSADIGTLPIGIVISAVGGLMSVFFQDRSALRPLGVWLYVAGAFVIGQAIIFSAAANQAAIYLVLCAIGFGISHTTPVRRISRRVNQQVDPFVETVGTRLGHWLGALAAAFGVTKD